MALAGVLLKDEPIATLPFHREKVPPEILPQSSIKGYEPGLSLARQLAHLLQLPTDLLLSVAGPLEWPRPLFEHQIEGIKALLSQ